MLSSSKNGIVYCNYKMQQSDELDKSGRLLVRYCGICVPLNEITVSEHFESFCFVSLPNF